MTRELTASTFETAAAKGGMPSRVRLVFGAVCAVSLFFFAQMLEDRMVQIGLIAGSITLLLLCVFDGLRQLRSTMQERNIVHSMRMVTEHDAMPAVLCDSDGEILWQNASAEQLWTPDLAMPSSVAHMLKDHISSPQVVLRRLKSAARGTGAAKETVVGLDASVRLHLQLIAGKEFWRIEILKTEREDVDAGTPTLLLGRNGVVLSMNQAARDLVGARAKSVRELFREPDLKDGMSTRIMTKNGERPVHISLQPTAAGRVRVFALPGGGDVESYGPRLDDLPLPAMCISAEGRILQANGLVAHLLLTPDCVGEPLDSVLEGLGNGVDEAVRQVVLGGVSSGPEVYRIKGSASEAFVQMTLKRVIQNETVILVAILNDATELKSLEAKFVQGQKMQAIGQLAGGVAHDFNNLLTAISGHCDLMLLRHDQGDQDYADLIQIHQNANRAAALVSQLLAFSRKQTLQPEYLDLRDTLSDLAHLLNRLVGEKVSLMLSHDPVLKPIRADKRQLEQVIMNLVVNARDAMPDGGQIQIDTESLTLSHPLKRDRVTVPAGDYVVVRVQDEGDGIHPDVIGKVFEPFFTTKRAGEGTGLGLSTAYGIVKQTGGYIFVDSQLGKGTCFSLMFAAQSAPAQVPENVQPKPQVLSAEPFEGVVLLVEDEAPVRAFASRALSLRGFDVLEASCAEEALDMLSDKDLSVDVFVTDVVMPGLDGPTWVREALKDRPDVRVIFVSGYAEGAFQGNDPGIPGAIFLPKPFSLNELTSVVQKQLN